MRMVVSVLTALALATLVVSTSPSDSVIDIPIAMPDPVPSAVENSMSRTEASLPDGTQFVVTVTPAVPDDWLATTGTLVLDLGDRVVEAANLVLVGDATGHGPENQAGAHRIQAAGHHLVFDLDPLARHLLGEEADETVANSIRGNAESGHPVLRLRDPFRWAEDQETSWVMAVRFRSFEVRRGCGELAVACSPEKSLQVIWRANRLTTGRQLEHSEIRIFRLVP